MVKKNKLIPWVFGIGLAIMIVLVVNLATDVFMNEPNYSDFCDYKTIPYDDENCRLDYQDARDHFNFQVFIIYSLIGVALIIASLFINMTFIEVAFMFSGFALMIEGLARNFDNKTQALISSIIIIALLVFVGVRKLKLD